LGCIRKRLIKMQNCPTYCPYWEKGKCSLGNFADECDFLNEEEEEEEYEDRYTLADLGWNWW
jgi:hypothetical protein